MYVTLEYALHDTLRQAVEEESIAGASVMLWQEGKGELFACEGMSDREAGRVMERDAIFRLHSMTKPIIAAAALRLMEQGKLGMEDRLDRYLPAFAREKDTDAPIRIYHLLNMTSGMVYPDGETPEGLATGKVFEEITVDFHTQNAQCARKDISTQEAVSQFAACPLAYEPGTSWSYGVSADVLGAVIEAVAGEKLSAYLRREIFEPLGMADTAFGVPTGKRDRLAAVYREVPDGAGAKEDRESDTLDEGEVSENRTASDRRKEREKQERERQEREGQERGSRRKISHGQRLALYEGDDLGLRHDAPAAPAFESGGAGLCGTLDDYLRFAGMLLREGRVCGAGADAGAGFRLLRPETVRYMTTSSLNSAQQRAFDAVTMFSLHRYTYGTLLRKCLRKDISPRLARYGEYGWGGQTGTDFVVFPVEDAIFLIGMQKKDARQYSLGKKIRGTVLRFL